MSACSRCNSHWPLPGCYVCGESLHEPETEIQNNTMNTTLTINSIRGLADQLEADAKAVREILAQAESGDISPEQAAALLKEQGIAII